MGLTSIKALSAFLVLLIALPSWLLYLWWRFAPRTRSIILALRQDKQETLPRHYWATLLVFPLYLVSCVWILNANIIEGLNFILTLSFLLVIEIASSILGWRVIFLIFDSRPQVDQTDITKNKLSELEELALDDLEEALLILKSYLSGDKKWQKLRNDTLQHLGVLRQLQNEQDMGVITAENYRVALAQRAQPFRNLLNKVKERL